MKKRKVIKGSNLQKRSPIFSGMALFLFLERFNAPEWLYGVFGLLFVVWFVAWIYDMGATEDVDIFNDEEITIKTFKERLNEKTRDNTEN
jgi:hypothetical protein